MSIRTIHLTLEEAVAFYASDTFNNSPAAVNVVQQVFGEGISLTQDEVNNVAAFLRVINAAFNAAIALQRVEAVQTIETAPGFGPSDITHSLLELAYEELEDAVRVLEEANLNKPSRNKFRQAMKKLEDIMAATKAKKRSALISNVIKKITDGKNGLGANLDFVMGEGNLAF